MNRKKQTEDLHEYSQVILALIILEGFPAVDLYVKHGSRYILYKNHDHVVTALDVARLRRTNMEFVYVRGAGIDMVQRFFEGNIELLFKEGVSDQIQKQILCTILLNYVAEVFKCPQEVPENVKILEKCKLLLTRLLDSITSDHQLLEVLSKIINHKVHLFVHSAQVAVLTMYTHQHFYRLASDELRDVGIGALFHDLGMTFVSSDILEHSNLISQQEYFLVRKHPVHGYTLLKQLGVRSPIVLSIVHSHHERFNGSGYPNSLFENEIPRSAQITSLCDVFCTLVADRPHRLASSLADALRLMTSERDMFNPDLFDKFCSLMIGENPQKSSSSLDEVRCKSYH